MPFDKSARPKPSQKKHMPRHPLTHVLYKEPTMAGNICAKLILHFAVKTQVAFIHSAKLITYTVRSRWSILVDHGDIAPWKYFKPNKPSLPPLLRTKQKQTVDQFVRKWRKNSVASKFHTIVTLPKKEVLLESTVLKIVQPARACSLFSTSNRNLPKIFHLVWTKWLA